MAPRPGGRRHVRRAVPPRNTALDDAVVADAQPSPSPYLADALAYLARGWPVFPVCRPIREGRCVQHGACPNAGKVPLVKWERYQTALPTVADVTGWWTRDRTANIGMATGALSGIVVLDCDSSEARQLAMEQGVPPTRAVWTGKPGGIHYHLAHPGFPVSNFARKRPGLDFRGDGGYVLLPPSHHARGADYRWVDSAESCIATAPDWLLDLIHAPTNGNVPSADHEPLDLGLLLAGAPEGQRDDLLWRYACKLRGENVPLAFADLFVRQAARTCRPPFDEAVAAEKVARAYREYAAPLTLDVPAGWSPFSSHVSSQSAELVDTYPVQSLAELVAGHEDVAAELVEGILWAERITWAFAAPGAGKTLFLVAVGMHVAAGRPFCGRALQHCPVLLIEEDSPFTVLSEYVELLADLYGFDLAALPFYTNRTQGLRITSLEGVAAVWSAVNGCPERPGLVIFDACESLCPSDKFTTRELDPLRQLVQGLTNLHITPVVIDHTRRPPSQAGIAHQQAVAADPMESLYGARAKQAISDVMMHFSGSPRGGLHITFAKFRGETPPPLDVVFDPDEGFAIKRRKARPQSEGQRLVLQWFNEYGGLDWHDRAAIHAGVRGSERTIDRALKALVKSGLLTLEGGDRGGTRYRALSVEAPDLVVTANVSTKNPGVY